MAPGKADFSLFTDFYQNELPRLGVDVRLNTTATDDLLASLGAGTFVLAAGSSRQDRQMAFGKKTPAACLAVKEKNFLSGAGFWNYDKNELYKHIIRHYDIVTLLVNDGSSNF